MRQLIIALLLLTTGCWDSGKEPDWFSPGNPDSSSRTIGIPKILKTEIDKEYVAHYRKSNPKTVKTDAEILDKIPRDSLDLVVSVWQARQGTLKDNYRYKLTRGGGEIDLARIISGEKGSIYLSLKVFLTGELEPQDDYKVYYVATQKPKKVDDDFYGAPCGTLVDVTDKIVRSSKGKAIRANITQDRHVPALTGYYYVVLFVDEKIHFGAIHIHDSRFDNKGCPDL
jgi:hypothetical protein